MALVRTAVSTAPKNVIYRGAAKCHGFWFRSNIKDPDGKDPDLQG